MQKMEIRAILLTAILVLSINVAFSEEIVNKSKINSTVQSESSQTVHCAKDQVPWMFDGVSVCRESLPNGFFRDYYENGKLAREEGESVYHGFYKGNSSVQTGTIKYTKMFKYFDNGNMQYSYELKDGQFKIRNYYESGELKNELVGKGQENVVRKYDKNGDLLSEEQNVPRDKLSDEFSMNNRQN